MKKCAGLMSVAIRAAVLFVATPQQDDVQLLNKMEKVRMIKGLKVCLRSNTSSRASPRTPAIFLLCCTSLLTMESLTCHNQPVRTS